MGSNPEFVKGTRAGRYQLSISLPVLQLVNDTSAMLLMWHSLPEMHLCCAVLRRVCKDL